MNATVADLQQDASEIIRAVVQRGEEIVLTDSGEPVAKIIPFLRTITSSPDEARRCGKLTDNAILTGLREAREEAVERSDLSEFEKRRPTPIIAPRITYSVRTSSPYLASPATMSAATVLLR